MADSKYGRLFTEDDVLALLRCGGFVEDAPLESDEDVRDALESALEVADAVRPLTFPPDEPLFLLRGQDKAAVPTVNCYLLTAREAGASEDHIAAANQAIRAMDEWQFANPTRMKVPD